MIFQYIAPHPSLRVFIRDFLIADFEQYFIENGTLEGMPTKEKTEEEYAITEKKYGMVYKTAR